MTQGKNKALKKGTKVKKNDKHPFTKKEWFRLITAPTFGTPKQAGWVPGNTTIGKKKAEDNVINRTAEIVYSDINEKSKFHWRKVKMQVEKVEGGSLYTSFGGLDCTREKIMSSLKKRQTLIEVFTDVKTSDGYILRVAVVLLTRAFAGQKKKNCYAKSSEVRRIRKLASKIMTDHAAKSDVTKFATEILADNLSETLINQCSKIYPLKVALVTKVKVMKKSKVDVGKLVEDSQTKKAVETVTDSAAGQNTLTKEIEEMKAKTATAEATK